MTHRTRRVPPTALARIELRVPSHVFGGWAPAMGWLRTAPMLALHLQANDNATTWREQNYWRTRRGEE